MYYALHHRRFAENTVKAVNIDPMPDSVLVRFKPDNREIRVPRGEKIRQAAMQAGVYIQASCGKCHFEPYVDGAPMLAIGKRLYDFYGCVQCHKIYKTGGAAGPELTKIAAKQANWYDWGEHHQEEMSAIEWLFNHFKNSQYYDPNSKMTDYAMNDANAKTLTIYMLSLADEVYPDEYYIDEKPFLKK